MDWQTKRRPIEAGRSLVWTLPVTEFGDHVAAGYHVKFQRVHVMVRGYLVAQARIIGAQHVAR
jgi:hypothetical protein